MSKNLIHNRLTIIGKRTQVSAVRKLLASQTGLPLDFNRIVAVPPELEETKKCPYATLLYKRDHEKEFLDNYEQKVLASLSRKDMQEALSLANKYARNNTTYGCIDSSRYKEIYWNTSHNALFGKEELSKSIDNQIHFITTNKAPIDLLTTFSKQIPLIPLLLEFSRDEFILNYHSYDIFNGEYVWNV